jgi:hypothetical protein
MELTEDQLSEIQMKVSDATSGSFRETILAFVKDYNKSKKELDGDHKDFYVSEDTIDALFSRACEGVIDQALRQHKW